MFKEQIISDTRHTHSFQIYQALKGIFGKLMIEVHSIMSKLVEELLCKKIALYSLCLDDLLIVYLMGVST